VATLSRLRDLSEECQRAVKQNPHFLP
jgi:hypothetical protein